MSSTASGLDAKYCHAPTTAAAAAQPSRLPFVGAKSCFSIPRSTSGVVVLWRCYWRRVDAGVLVAAARCVWKLAHVGGCREIESADLMLTFVEVKNSRLAVRNTLVRGFYWHRAARVALALGSDKRN